jgi:hypothetical protein
VVKQRQLARQVGAFSASMIKNFMDFDKMIFPMGSIFIFRSSVYEADNKGILQGHLVEAWKPREEITLPIGSAEDLAERYPNPTVSESTQAPTTTNLSLMSGSNSSSRSNLGSSGDEPSSFPIGLWNTTSTLQEINSNLLPVSS